MLTKISLSPQRLRGEEDREPVSGFLASLCPLVDSSSLASRGKSWYRDSLGTWGLAVWPLPRIIPLRAPVPIC